MGPQSAVGIWCWLGEKRHEMGWAPPFRPDFMVFVKNDILMLEKQIRQLLQCECLSECNIIKTTPYKQMIISVLLKMNHIISFDAECKIYFGSNTMLLFMHSDAKTIEIKKKDTEKIVTLEDEDDEFQKLNNDENIRPVEDIVYDHRLNDQRKRKYPRKHQEDSFVAQFIHERLSSTKPTIILPSA